MEMYVYKNGFFNEWFDSMNDRSQAKALNMINKLEDGNTRHCRQVVGKNIKGLWEMRTRTGERIFYGNDRKNNRSLILGGCTKRDQKQAIKRVQKMWKTYKLDINARRKELIMPLSATVMRMR